MLVEGSSMRSISRVLGISFNTVKKLLVDAGRVCLWYHDMAVRDVRARYVECDEIWAFCYSKERNAAQAKGVIDWAGDVWTWTGMDSKLMISWLVGKPVMSEVSTSRVERHNLTIRMSQRRFARLTNAFSKKVDNHRHSMALFCVWYNFCRPHMSLKGSTPAQVAGLIKYPRDMRWIVDLMDYLAPAPKRGP